MEQSFSFEGSYILQNAVFCFIKALKSGFTVDSLERVQIA